MLHRLPWEPGMAPAEHPRYADQIALELEMVRRGVMSFRQHVANAKDPGARKLDRKTGGSKAGRYPAEMTRIHTIRSIMRDYVGDLGRAIDTWYKGHGAKRGPKPLAWHHIEGLDPDVVAFIVVSTIMDSAGLGHLGLSGVSQHIGRQIEQEQRMAAWIKEEPALWKEVQDGLKRQKATDLHRLKVNINRFNKLVAEKVQWHDWSATVHKQVGLKLIDILCRMTPDFWVGPDPLHIATGKKADAKARIVLGLSNDLLKVIASRLNKDESKFPQYLPTLMPPKRWEGIRNGAYYSPYCKVPFLIRFKADGEEVQEIATEEYDTLDMPRVYDAVHAVQEVPWRINQRVLEVAHKVWERDLGIAGFSHREPQEIPPRPWGSKNPKDVDPEVVRKWKRKAAQVYGDNARILSTTHTVRMTLWIADKFVHEEVYFPHMLDFRGRMYPIPVFLNPQGQDLARGLLTFAHGRPITVKDAGWLAIHLANTWGFDKASFDERIQWVDERQDMWLRIAVDPMKSLEWTRLEDPWQGLAAALEWARWLQEGEGMVSSLPIRVDGTCNGLQHLSALMKDRRGGAAVNLIPSDKPRDIYREVGEGLRERLVDIRNTGGKPGHLADLWLSGLNEEIPRGLTKGPVMVLPYGGTKDSYFGSIIKWLAKEDPEGKKVIAKEDRKEAVPFLKDRMWDEVNAEGSVLSEAKKCMDWIKACTEYVTSTGGPIFWTTPTGFHVRHFYGQVKMKRVKTQINGKRIDLADYSRTKKLAKREQLQGISPNFVHSLDASTNMETALRFAEATSEERAPFTTIHDAFGTVAGQMWTLYHCIREAFVFIHSTDALADFRDRCVVIYSEWLYTKNPAWTLDRCWETAEDAIPRCPPRGTLDVREVLKSDYFFA